MITKRDAAVVPRPRDVWISPIYGRVEVRFVDLDHVYVKSDKLEFSPTPRQPPLHWNGSPYGNYFEPRHWASFTAESTCVRRGDTTLTVPWTWHLGVIPIGAPVLWTEGRDAGQGVVQASSWDTTVIMDGKRTVTLDGDERMVELDLAQHTGRMLGALVAAKEKWGTTFFTPYVAWMGRTNGLGATFAPKDACWSLYTINKDGEQLRWDIPEALTFGVERSPNETLMDMSPAAHAWALWTLLTTIATGETPA